ncbi:hypothetical protein B0I35DRAFT_442192, partial [Stachybotrys elegans]
MDIEAYPELHRNGYAAVAAWMARDLDNETYIYRKFDQLGARNLLHLQSELIVLEAEVKAHDAAYRSSLDKRIVARTWESLRKDAAAAKLVDNLQSKIKEYHEALLLQSQIARLEAPSHRALSAFRKWFKGEFPAEDGRDVGPVLGGLAKFALDSPEDLIALRSMRNRDPLSRLLRNHWPFHLHARRQGLAHTTIFFPERHVELAVAIINAVVAMVLLIGAVLTLYFVTGSAARLGLIAFFMIFFASCVGVLTNARRVELLAATAAYGAVLVVFVTSDLAN